MAYELNATFAALSDPTRRAILASLSQGELSVKELSKPFSIAPPSMTKHLKVLERAGLTKVKDLYSFVNTADGVDLAALLAARNVTVLQATPATWRLLIDADWKGSDFAWHQYLKTSEVNGVVYFDEGNGESRRTR